MQNSFRPTTITACLWCGQFTGEKHEVMLDRNEAIPYPWCSREHELAWLNYGGKIR